MHILELFFSLVLLKNQKQMAGKKIIILFFLLITLGIGHSRAQYVNTDSLVFSSDFPHPVNINFYNAFKSKEEIKKGGYFSQFLVPGNGGNIISPYGLRSGRMHYGTDIKMEKGDTVSAVFDGYIVSSSYGRGFGNLIVIQHENNITTYYAHLSAYLVKAGAWVEKGEPIGLAGSTGRAKGSHLHFEIHEDEKTFDSELVFDYANQQIRKDAKHVETLAALHKELKPQGYAKKVAVPEFYKVCPGDSLWIISRKFKTSINEICRLNQITENTVLQIGQPLRMY